MPPTEAAALPAQLARIADALERLAPPPRAAPDFSTARLFRFEAESLAFAAAPDFEVPLALLLGVDDQKRRVLQNLCRFADGLAFNNVLLWGARGVGKSSLAKAAFMELARRAPPGAGGSDAVRPAALKLVEIERDAISALPRLFDLLRGREERFVVLCDDLSFEEGAAAAKALKSALEGGVAGPPDNVLFLATSNRRHLMPRGHGEADGALSAAEDAEETVSASDRFGLWIGFPPMDQPTYLGAVAAYADRLGLAAPDLERRALQWAQRRGARSGRVAWQFVLDLAGEAGRPTPF